MLNTFKSQSEYLRYVKRQRAVTDRIFSSSDYTRAIKEKTLDCSSNIIN
jgi:hypothetical protein